MTATIRTRILYGPARAEQLCADHEPYDPPFGFWKSLALWLGLFVGGWGLVFLVGAVLLFLGKVIANVAWTFANGGALP